MMLYKFNNEFLDTSPHVQQPVAESEVSRGIVAVCDEIIHLLEDLWEAGPEETDWKEHRTRKRNIDDDPTFRFHAILWEQILAIRNRMILENQ